MKSVRRVLMIAYFFPPFGTVGHATRVTKFARYLRAYGWEPVVLTIRDDPQYRLFERSSASLLAEIPTDIQVCRTRALQPRAALAKPRRLAVDRPSTRDGFWIAHGRLVSYFRTRLLVPDIAMLWALTAVPAAVRLVRRRNIDLIWSTIPLNGAGIIGMIVKRLTGRPLIVDIRDDWVDGAEYGEKSRLVQAAERQLERMVLGTADAVVTISDLSYEIYVRRYPEWESKLSLIPNGFDFSDLDAPVEGATPDLRSDGETITIIHAGTTGPFRTPVPFLRAVRQLLDQQPQLAERLKVLFVGTLLPEYHKAVVDLRLEHIVENRAYLPHDSFLGLLRSATLSLAIVDGDVPASIPGKLYTYWAVGKPVILLGREGAASRLVRDYGLGWHTAPDNVEAIYSCLHTAMDQARTGNLPHIALDGLRQFDRQRLTHELAALFNNTAARGSHPAP